MRNGKKRAEHGQVSRGLIFLMAFACGAMVANLYYAQTLIDQIGPEIGLSKGMAGAITTLTQLGYGIGLFAIVPLGDIFENRRLAVILTFGTVLACLGIGFSQGPVTFLGASLLTGICATGAQILLPLASHLAPEDRQGRTIGEIMSGLLAGIMLARPAASFMAQWIGWRSVFYASAGLMTLIGVALIVALPRREPRTNTGYLATLYSMLELVRRHRRVQLRAFYQAALFAAFNLFWTAAPLTLLRQFHFTQKGVAFFALAGAGGALAAPLAGWMSDRGKTWLTTLAAHLILIISFIASGFTVAMLNVVAFAAAAFFIDAAVQLNQVTGQKIIFEISREARSRINSIYMTLMFVFGASGSVIGTATYASGGWWLSCGAGTAIGGLSFAVFLMLDRTRTNF